MAVFTRQQLSGAGNGGVFFLSVTSAANAETIHQVQATSTDARESVWLELKNRRTGIDHMLILVLDSATATSVGQRFYLEDRASATGPVSAFNGIPLTGTDTLILAYSATATGNHTTVTGYVNRIATG